MTKQEFISHEISVWGESYIESLLDTGYEPVLLSSSNSATGSTRAAKWSWVLPAKSVLTTPGFCDTVSPGRVPSLLPFR